MNPHLLLADRRISNAVKPAIESLEQRLLLSVETPIPVVSANTATLRNGTLLVQGSDKADTIVMSLAPTDHGLLDVNINGKAAGRFSLAAVNIVRTYGLGGSDKITVDESEDVITTRIDMFGGNGNDSLSSGSGNDLIIGGKGDDLLQGNDGKDYIEGNAGNDRILAGAGADTVNGGPGADTINTGAGRDKVIGQTPSQQVDLSSAIVATANTKLHYAGTQVTKRLGKRGRPAAFNGTVVGLTPQQIRTAYNFGDLSDASFTNRGAGQTIAVIVPFHAPTALADLNIFSAQFGLPAVGKKMFSYVYASGNQPNADRRWATEQALDVQWAHAIAPNARILLVEADTDLTADLFNAVEKASQALHAVGGGVVSMTFEAPEFFTDRQFDDEFRTLFTDDVSMVAAAGDFPGEVSHPGVDEEVLSVGGTTLQVDGAGNRVDESVWSNTGGGVSQVFDRPGYQDKLFVDGAAIGDTRVVPDVAFDADPLTGAVAVYSTARTASGDSGWLSVGGTSVGAPTWAGLVTLANEKRVANGLPIIGNGQLNNYIYGIARKFGDTTFNDIINGDNFAHQATIGYDAASGWGTPQATALIDQLAIAQSKNRVSSRVNLHFIWEGDLRKDLLFPLVNNVAAVVNYTGEGTAKIAPTAADLLFDQGFSDPLTGITPIPADQIDFGALDMDRIGNTIIGRGVASVVTADGYVANLVIRYEGRIFRVNGRDKITGKMFAISHHGIVLKQGQDAVFTGEFNSPGDSNP